MVFQCVSVEFGREKELGLTTGSGTVVWRCFAGMVDGHVRLEAGGRGENCRTQITRKRFAAGKRVLDQVRLEAVGRG